MQTIAIRTNLRQLSWVPKQGEHFASVNVAMVPDLMELWQFAQAIGCNPELVTIQHSERIEVHLLLLHEQLEPGTLVEFGKWDGLIERLAEVGIPDDAIRHTYGGQMARVA